MLLVDMCGTRSAETKDLWFLAASNPQVRDLIFNDQHLILLKYYQCDVSGKYQWIHT